MRKLQKILIALILITLGNVFYSQKSFADVNDFYFENADFEYYLDKSTDGYAQMKVKETLTAVFPEQNQNHGIIRCLPRYHNGQKVIEDISINNFSIKRNSNSENATVETSDDQVCITIGKANTYVTGSQVYEITYNLKNVISEYPDSENQELYWDTNGNGWGQKFQKLTAKIHLSDELKTAWIKDLNCYVGKYGENGTERCIAHETEDGAEFTTETLLGGETLTFDLGFNKETFSTQKATEEEFENFNFRFIRGDTNSFYIKSFEADYYIDKKEDNSVKMEVEEQITAVFPPFEQNHGIERCIPLYYKNRSIFDNLAFSVKRNGNDEPFTTYKENGNICLRIGNANSFVTNLQTYTITYNLTNVISEYQDSENQELYWNTNGNNWPQQFLKLTARIHLSNTVKDSWIGDLNCYVGKYGESGTSRCAMRKTDDGASFTAYSLSSRENLTFDIGFKQGTFFIPEPDKNYILFVFLGIYLILVVFGIRKWIKSEEQVKQKKQLAKSKIISPEFTPKAGFTVAEMAENYLKSTGSSRVASLLELAVKKHISLEKGEKKLFGGYKWKIHVHNIDHIPTEQSIILQILNGGKTVANNSIIEVKTHTATSTLERLSRSFDTTIISSLKNKGLFESNTKTSASTTTSIAIAIIFILVCMFLPPFIASLVTLITTEVFNRESVIYVGASYIIPILIIGFIIYFIIFVVVISSAYKYKKRTIEGIKMSKYMDGLKRYMKLAEEDRIKFLQSVDGADTSNAGIVKLYEKLLPYAVLFNLEDSWLKELNKYYEVEHIQNDWTTAHTIISASDFRSFTSYTSSSIASSSSSSSSGSSGGGGGGFSGGGGGGGGGGGW